MCRWLAYSGSPILLEKALYSPAHSLIDQSLHSQLGAETTNGDGFGIGWYDDCPMPGVFRSIEPAWNDQNLRELSAHVTSGHFFAHIRAAIGSAVQQTNCHPFRHGRWIFVHNGFIDRFAEVRRDLILAVDPELFPLIQGTTDSEVIFYLALTFGLENDPLDALERMAGFVEAVGHDHDIAEPLQMTVGISNGERLYAVRYASGPEVNTLYVSEDARAVRMLYPEDERLTKLSDEARAIVSEPLSDLPGLWHEVGKGEAMIVQNGPDVLLPFRPRVPAELGDAAPLW
jgi:predicted glutamine amidotransferase